MEASRNSIRGGLWNNPGPRQYSKDTQDMLMCELMAFLSRHNGDECVCVRVGVFEVLFLSWFSVMMQESRLTNLQKRQITDCLQSRFETCVGCILSYFQNTNASMSHPHVFILLRRNIPTTAVRVPLACPAS